MLEQLVVRNLVLVRSATLDLHPGMNDNAWLWS